MEASWLLSLFLEETRELLFTNSPPRPNVLNIQPGYFYARLTEDEARDLKATGKVFRLVDQTEIDKIRARMALTFTADDKATIDPSITEGGMVSIRSGPFKGRTVPVIKLQGTDARVWVEIMGAKRVLTIPLNQLRGVV
jgi:transcription antitermination factor NusG